MRLASAAGPLASEVPMTVIAAMHGDDHVLLGADSDVADEHFRRSEMKLMIVTDAPGRRVIWGLSCDEGVALLFTQWLSSYGWTA